jgi:DNA-binding transcriptional regulator YiaG
MKAPIILPTLEDVMTANDYRAALKRLELSQRGAAALLGVAASTGQEWADKGPSPPAAFAIQLMLALRLTGAEARARIVLANPPKVTSDA